VQQIRVAEDLSNTFPGGIETGGELGADKSRVALVTDLLCILIEDDRLSAA
jgi:hypothetical protein